MLCVFSPNKILLLEDDVIKGLFELHDYITKDKHDWERRKNLLNDKLPITILEKVFWWNTSIREMEIMKKHPFFL